MARPNVGRVYSRSDDAVIRVYDEACNVIETHEQAGDFTSSGCVNAHFAIESSDGFANHKTRKTTSRRETVLVKRSLRAIVVWLSIAMLISSADVANAGPFRNFFRALRSAIAHPDETPRPHRSSRSSHKHNETPPSDAPNSEASATPVPAPPGGDNVRMAKAALGTNQQKADLPHGSPVPGKPWLVTSPFAPDRGYVDVTGFPPGTEVEDPYTGKIFLTP